MDTVMSGQDGDSERYETQKAALAAEFQRLFDYCQKFESPAETMADFVLEMQAERIFTITPEMVKMLTNVAIFG